MSPNIALEHANELRGCLSQLRTNSGRRQYQEKDDLLVMESDFVTDEAKIISSKAFRRMQHKTQVITAPTNVYIRTREAHVLEVVAVSVVIADVLGLNRDLVRAIALGHDIGHIPFGHPGEHFLAKHMGRKEFCHEVMAPLVTQKVERAGRGLNLTYETLEGMMCHSGNTAREGMTQEAWVVRYTDKFAYIFADYNDVVLRMGYPVSKELRELMDTFGGNQRERTTTAMAGLVIESAEACRVSFEKSDLAHKFNELRRLMYAVYVHVTQQNLGSIIEPVLDFFAELGLGDPYFLYSMLTDKDVAFLASKHSRNITHLRETSLAEILPHMDRIGTLDLCNPYLDW